MPLHSQAGDWNPLLIGFAGINLNPFFNIPVFVKLQDNEWKQVIELLINRAQIIVFDISEKSDAIEAEFEMIEQAECWQKTLFLQNNYENTNYELEQNIKIRSARIINYRKSWIRGIPRMISGFVILLVLFVLLDKALGQLHPVFRILCRLSEFLLFAWLYFQFFIYPSVDRAAKISLKKILGTHTKSNLARQI
jgi:hypothetical protein